MGKIEVKKFILAVIALSVMVFAACNGEINGSINEDGSGSFTVETVLIKSLVPQFGKTLSASQVEASFKNAPGISSISMKDRGNGFGAIGGEVLVNNIGDFLKIPAVLTSHTGNAKQFIDYDSAGRITVTINRDTSPAIISLLSQDMQDYLSVLQPPVLMGTVLSKAAYLKQLKVFGYNDAMISELDKAKITVNIEFPRPLKEIKGGVKSAKNERSGVFDLALIDLMVLEKETVWQAIW
ncbi:MAG: hypothetical protein LBM77_14085 [Spirochaetaceae bacterium]|jgi:hypothetical protein|nr:hypothetical protein [Spirochaetaceae bacterium]